jgi:hypothetical protein
MLRDRSIRRLRYPVHRGHQGLLCYPRTRDLQCEVHDATLTQRRLTREHRAHSKRARHPVPFALGAALAALSLIRTGRARLHRR